MSILRSNFLPVGKCHGGTEGRPSWAPNRSGRIGPVVGARHGVPPKTLLSFSGGRRWTATGVLSSRRGPDEGLLPTRPLTNCLRRETAGWPFMNSFLAPLLLPRGRAAIIPPCVSLRREFGNCEPLRPKQNERPGLYCATVAWARSSGGNSALKTAFWISTVSNID